MSAESNGLRAPATASVAAQATATRSPVTVLICALGGEGGGVLSEWLVDTARNAGYAAQSTSIPGVAQRTGATTYYVEVFPVPLAELGGRRPVFSLYPIPGALDVLVSSELLETVRQIGHGLATPERTHIITSSARALTTHERMQLADGRVPAAPLIDIVRQQSARHHVLDMAAMTREAGTVVSAVMFGAIAADGTLPFTRAQCERTIAAGGRGAEASRAGFALAYEQVRRQVERGAFVAQMLGASDRHSSAPPMPDALARRFPPATHAMLALGYDRVREYQDGGYAGLYVERLERVLDAERRGDPEGANGFATTAETARSLALWMAFDDIVRVAELKSRASREARVRREVKVRGDELLRIYDHFKPGIPEMAGLLSPRWAERALRFDRRRQARGKPPLGWPIKLGSHTILGMLALRCLGGLKGMRRHGARYAVEQQAIGRWLSAVEEGVAHDWSLGHEIALCGRLIKGYGSTNERGKENLLHIVEHLASRQDSPDAVAAAVRDARLAALADEGGIALDRTLATHGAAPRPVKATPIRFVRTPKPTVEAGSGDD